MFAFTTPIVDRRPNHLGRLRLPNHANASAQDAGAVRLRPEWLTILSMSRFARRATWLFGNGSGVVECVDQSPRSCVAPRRSGDATSLRLDFTGWETALMRPDGRARTIEFFDANGFPIAALHLADCDASIDQFIWLLADDSETTVVPLGTPRAPRYPDAHDRVRSILPIAERREDFDRLVSCNGLQRGEAFAIAGAFVATPLRPDALALALYLATESSIRLQLRLENAGGAFTWSPAILSLFDEGDYLELRSAFGRMHLDRRTGPAWMVHLTGADGSGPSIETQTANDGGSIRIDAVDDLDRPGWRVLCRYVASEAAARAR